MRFHEILKRLIEERGLTQKQLACELKIPVSTLGGYVQGTSEPDFETLKIFANFFGTSTDYLLNHSNDALSFEELDLIRTFRSLNPKEQKIYIEQGKAFIKTKEK